MNIKLSERFGIVIFLLNLFLLIFVSFIFVFFFLLIDRSRKMDNLKMESSVQVDYQKNLMLDDLSHIKSDLLFLPQLNEMLRYRELSNDEDRRLIENEFLEFSKNKRDYDQIRFLDEWGNEVVRINLRGDSSIKVPLNELQNKGDRYYFSETLKLDEGEVYISPFDLNVEENKIEIPLKPMIRIGTPVLSVSGQKKGIIIFNYLGNRLLDNLKEATLNKPGIFSLLNKEGFWLYNMDKEMEWGFMYPEKSDRNLPTVNPEKWRLINQSSRLQITTKKGIQTSVFINLFDESQSNSDEYWILENTISFEEAGISWRQYLYRIRFISLFILLFDLLIAYILTIIVSQRNQLQQEMEKLALYDSLTKLPNRRLLYERAERTLIQSRRYAYSLAIFYIDLDGFKSVNDTFGHDAGDQLLIKVSERLHECVRTSDTVSRVGGDEFVILITQIHDEENCAIIARKILKKLALDYYLSEGKANIQGSIGIAFSHPKSEESVEELINKADAAMYEVKKSGKNSYKIFQEESEK